LLTRKVCIRKRKRICDTVNGGKQTDDIRLTICISIEQAKKRHGIELLSMTMFLNSLRTSSSSTTPKSVSTHVLSAAWYSSLHTHTAAPLRWCSKRCLFAAWLTTVRTSESLFIFVICTSIYAIRFTYHFPLFLLLFYILFYFE